MADIVEQLLAIGHNTDGMQCGHDRCRHWWASQGRYLWYGVQCDSLVACVLPCTSAVPIPLSFYPSNFLPRQPAVVYLKKLNPDKNQITHAHVLKSLGDASRGLTEDQTRAMIAEFQEEAVRVIAWGNEEVKNGCWKRRQE